MTNNTLKSTIETIRATDALIVVTLHGVPFNSQTGSPILPGRVTVEAVSSFLKQYCDRLPDNQISDARKKYGEQLLATVDAAQKALAASDYAGAAKLAQRAAEQAESINEVRHYFKLKENLDLRTVAEKRAAKKAENEARRAEQKSAKEAAAPKKLEQKVAPAASPAPQQPAVQPKGSKKAA